MHNNTNIERARWHIICRAYLNALITEHVIYLFIIHVAKASRGQTPKCITSALDGMIEHRFDLQIFVYALKRLSEEKSRVDDIEFQINLFC